MGKTYSLDECNKLITSDKSDRENAEDFMKCVYNILDKNDLSHQKRWELLNGAINYVNEIGSNITMIERKKKEPFGVLYDLDIPSLQWMRSDMHREKKNVVDAFEKSKQEKLEILKAELEWALLSESEKEIHTLDEWLHTNDKGNDIKREITMLTLKDKKTNEKLDKLSSDIINAKNELAPISKESQNQLKKISSIRGEEGYTRREVRAINDDISKWREHLGGKIGRLDGIMQALDSGKLNERKETEFRSEIPKLKDDITNLTKIIDGLKMDLEPVKQAHEEAETMLKEIKSTANPPYENEKLIKDQLETMTTQKQELETEKTKIKSEIAIQKERLDEWNEERTKRKIELDEKRTRLPKERAEMIEKYGTEPENIKYSATINWEIKNLRNERLL